VIRSGLFDPLTHEVGDVETAEPGSLQGQRRSCLPALAAERRDLHGYHRLVARTVEWRAGGVQGGVMDDGFRPKGREVDLGDAGK
jgi:hypothetical protein